MLLNKKLTRLKKSGLTLIETLFAITIGAVVIINVILFISEQTYQQRMKIHAGQIMTINSALMRRVMHDGISYERLLGNISGVDPTSNFVTFTGDEFETVFINKILTPLGACNNTDSEAWEPLDSTTGSAIQNTPLLPCNLMRSLDTFGLEYSALIVRDINPSSASGDALALVSIFIDFNNSEMFTRSGGLFSGTDTNANRMVQFVDYLEAAKSADLIGTQSVIFTSATDFSDPTGLNRDITSNECFFGSAPENCRIELGVSFTGGANQQYLRVDGQNAMLAPVRFSFTGADAGQGNYQQCLRWTLDGSGNWVQDVVDCGIRGGFDTSMDTGGDGVETVTNRTSTEGIFITVRDKATTDYNVVDYNPATCTLYDDPTFTSGGIGESYYEDLGLAEEVPCGIYDTSDDPNNPIIQAVTTLTNLSDLFVNNAVLKNVTARRLYVRDIAGGSEIFKLEDENGVLVHNVVYNAASGRYDFFYEGDFEFVGDSIFSGNMNIDGNVNIDGDLTQTGRSTFNLETFDYMEINIIDEGLSARLGLGNINGNDYFEIFGGDRFALRSNNNLYLRADNSISLDSNEVRLENNSNLIITEDASTYSEVNQFGTANRVDFSAASSDELELRKLATFEHIQHLNNIRSNIVLRYVNVISPENSVLPKPDCLDFASTSINSALYSSGSLPANGQSLARIVMVPISMKTYSNLYGNNQFYTHHAQDTGGAWQMYFYISGDGIGSTGAREDGAGTSLAMVYCDYTGVDFGG